MNYVFCNNCEENFRCMDAEKRDGCEFGIATIPDDDDDDEKKENEDDFDIY